jgi:hypothetical protein
MLYKLCVGWIVLVGVVLILRAGVGLYQAILDSPSAAISVTLVIVTILAVVYFVFHERE